MENLKVLCLDQIKTDKHGNLENLKEDFLDPQSEPFSNLCKRAEKEGLNYKFENEILTVWKTKTPYESNWKYELFWHDYPTVNTNVIEID